MSKSFENSLLPGLESRKNQGDSPEELSSSDLFFHGIFGLLPLSEFAKNEQWLVRDAMVPAMPPPPPPPPTEVEKIVEKSHRIKLKHPSLHGHPLLLTQVLWIFLWMYPQEISDCLHLSKL